jgi:hypothetical protein
MMTIKRTVILSYDRDHWQLYSDTPFDVVDAINEGIGEAMSNSKDWSEAYHRSMEILRRWDKYGACDSEPIGFLEILLDRLFTNV